MKRLKTYKEFRLSSKQLDKAIRDEEKYNKILGLNSDENYSQRKELDLSIKKIHELQGKILDVKKDISFVKNKKNSDIYIKF